MLFGQVDQVEVDAERPHQLQQTRGGLLFGPGEQRLVGALAAAQFDRTRANVLDGGEQPGAALLAQHIADQLAQQPYVVTQAVDGLRPDCHLLQSIGDV